MENLDSTIDSTENSRFSALYGGLIKEIAANSKMSTLDITCLLCVYYKFVRFNGPGAKQMKKNQFYQIYLVLFNVANVQVIERSLLAITKDTKFVSPRAWIDLFELYTTEDLDRRMKFAFEVYDTKNTGVIDREQVGVACEKFFHEGDDEDELIELRADMTEFIMKKFDVDKDGVISFEDYSSVVSQQPVLVEFLGWLFPSNEERDLMAHVINMDSLLNYCNPDSK
ncbi:EF-hand calcium-binding domain-containing protein 1 isoform X1 [Drosophila teissieri]|uniref:EF-hand calcium-binding domain-containing protein 1 isoform X1 n=1 Tax=Drosophila teissieri TaxID=7243 RepID=UPI001CBA1A13|nr:EF-hand calcium-binding domain-containing protein 1 isoform X1 [Drosophila teissieri]